MYSGITEITTNKQPKDYKVGDKRHFFEVSSSWSLTLDYSKKIQELFKSIDSSSDEDFSIYLVEQICTFNNKKGDHQFLDVSKVLVSEANEQYFELSS